jgi:hypothetical protein
VSDLTAGQLVIRDDVAGSRYVALSDGVEVGELIYLRDEEILVASHTYVSAAAKGLGVGSALARHVVEEARTTGRGLLPLCHFVSGWMGKHPDSLDVLLPYTPPGQG